MCQCAYEYGREISDLRQQVQQLDLILSAVMAACGLAYVKAGSKQSWDCGKVIKADTVLSTVELSLVQPLLEDF